VDRKTAVARKLVQDPETAMIHEQHHMGNVEKGCLTTTQPEISFEEMLNAIRDCLSNLECSEDVEYRKQQDDDEDDTGHGKLSEDDEPGWVMGTILKKQQHRIKSLGQKQMKIDEMTHLGWGGRGRLHLGERYDVRDDLNEGSSFWEAPMRVDCSRTITDNIWRAYAAS
jgi:hypothetical protein